MTNYQNMCDEVLELDGSIRYAAIADHLGSLIARAYRTGLVPLSPKEETEKYTMQAIQRTGAIQGGSRVGKLQYAIGKYENLIRATIPVISARQDKFYLMLSFDPGSDPIWIIEGRVMASIEKNRQWF